MCRCKNNPCSINPNTGKLYKTCDKCRESIRKWKKNNRDKIREYDRKWQENNPFKLWISNSKQADIKYNRYDPENFITKEYCKQIIDECKGICYYCNCQLDWKPGVYPNRATIERLNNSKGHVIGNCVVACFICNAKRLSDISS